MTGRMPIRICGTGRYLPDEVLSNEHFAGYLDTSDEWIVARTGIRQRHRAASTQATSDLAANAARSAIENAGLAPDAIDLIIVATATGDSPFPATAAFVQSHLGLTGVPAFDVSAACAGFLYASNAAAGMISSGMYEHVLVIGAETLTRATNPEDRSTVVLFGDAAGAAIYGPAERDDQGILYCDMGCDATKTDHIWIPAGGSRLPNTPSTLAEGLQFMHMRGREVYKFAVIKLQELIDNALQATDLTPADLKLLIPHQSNLRIIESAREKLGLPRNKVAVNIDRYGNTSAASVIMSLDEARRSGQVTEGDVILMVAIGAGLTWSTMVVRL